MTRRIFINDLKKKSRNKTLQDYFNIPINIYKNDRIYINLENICDDFIDFKIKYYCIKNNTYLLSKILNNYNIIDLYDNILKYLYEKIVLSIRIIIPLEYPFKSPKFTLNYLYCNDNKYNILKSFYLEKINLFNNLLFTNQWSPAMTLDKQILFFICNYTFFRDIIIISDLFYDYPNINNFNNNIYLNNTNYYNSTSFYTFNYNNETNLYNAYIL